MAWLFYTGRTRLNCTEEEVGRMSLVKFFRLYEVYKNMFDIEMLRTANRITYRSSTEKITMDEAIPF